MDSRMFYPSHRAFLRLILLFIYFSSPLTMLCLLSDMLGVPQTPNTLDIPIHQYTRYLIVNNILSPETITMALAMATRRNRPRSRFESSVERR